MNAGDLKYVLDANAEEPIILIHGDIGYPEGTMGDQFVKELMYLDTLGKTRIQAWVNTGGGVVTEGEMMCNALLKSKTPVDTYNTGTAASVGYPIFACGRKRIMMNWAKNMFHNPFGGDDKSLEAFKKTLLALIVGRSNGKLNEEQMSAIMDRETWIMAEESLEMGLCDEIEYCETYNKAEAIKNLGPKASRAEVVRVLNQVIENKNLISPDMDKVTNRLDLVKGSNEDAINAAIDKIVNQAKFDKGEYEKAKAEWEKKEKDYIETKAKFDALQAKFDEMNKVAAEANAKAKAVEAKEYIAKAVKLGKIEDKAETIEKLEKQFISNEAGTKDIIDALPAKVSGIEADVIENGGDKKKTTYHIADVRNEARVAYEKRRSIVQ